MPHREEREFQLVLHLLAEFPDDYAGDDDGFCWVERFELGLKPKIVRAVFDAIRSDPHFQAIAAPRGRDPESALDIDVVWKVDKPH